MMKNPEINDDKRIFESFNIIDDNNDIKSQNDFIDADSFHVESVQNLLENNQSRSYEKKFLLSEDNYLYGVCFMILNVISFAIMDVSVKYILYKNPKYTPFDTIFGWSIVQVPINGLYCYFTRVTINIFKFPI